MLHFYRRDCIRIFPFPQKTYCMIKKDISHSRLSKKMCTFSLNLLYSTCDSPSSCPAVTVQSCPYTQQRRQYKLSVNPGKLPSSTLPENELCSNPGGMKIVESKHEIHNGMA